MDVGASATLDRPLGTRSDNLLLKTVVPAAVLYNGVLAIINAHVMPLGFAHVALAELGLLMVAMAYIVFRGIGREALSLVFLVIFYAMVTAFTTVANATLYVDFFRNALIIAVFCQLGWLAGARTVEFIFRFTCALVLAVLVVETFSTRIYEDLFYPALYFINTRGLEQIAFDGSKLFQNAIKIPGRFSFGIADHRTASVFLEQVSLANFAGVLCLYLIARFRALSTSDRVMMISTVVLILLTNDSRSMLAFSVICLAGYFAFPRIGNGLRALVMPAIILAGAVVYAMRPDASGDTLDGRVVLTMKGFFDLDFVSLLALNVREANTFADSGYLYVINASTVFGLIVFWLFVTFYPGGATADQKRFAYALGIFIFMNMMIGGNAIFSIKVGALIWMLTGFMKQETDAAPLTSSANFEDLERTDRL